MTDKTDQTLLNAFPTIEKKWDDDIIPVLEQYIRIPNKSPMFDPDWETNGHMAKAMQLIVDWCQKQNVKGMELKLLQAEHRTPVLFIEVAGDIDDTILLYGHMDKQPEMAGWDEDLGPWKPVIKDDKLYGRGGADDGYSTFSALTAIQTLQENNIPHARCVLLIEASEESGSNDLPHYLKALKSDIGTPELIICLDSGAANYDQMWNTTSLRGFVGGTLNIKVLTEGIHSGFGSGVVPGVFNVLRDLLARVENSESHHVTLDALQPNIPQERIDQAHATAEQLGASFSAAYPWYGDAQAVNTDVAESILNRTWRAALTVTGIDGLPCVENAGNVTLPELSVKLSLRTPPLCDVDAASNALKQTLEDSPPHGATVTFTPEASGKGWHAPQLDAWLMDASDKASHLFYNKPTAYLGEGGSIPFMGMLGEMFPNAQFLITGVLGPKSNAHGPNEFLHIPMVKKITGCIASVIASHYEHKTT